MIYTLKVVYFFKVVTRQESLGEGSGVGNTHSIPVITHILYIYISTQGILFLGL